MARLTHGVLLPKETRLNVYVDDTLLALLGTILANRCNAATEAGER